MTDFDAEAFKAEMVRRMRERAPSVHMNPGEFGVALIEAVVDVAADVLTEIAKKAHQDRK